MVHMDTTYTGNLSHSQEIERHTVWVHKSYHYNDIYKCDISQMLLLVDMSEKT